MLSLSILPPDDTGNAGDSGDANAHEREYDAAQEYARASHLSRLEAEETFRKAHDTGRIWLVKLWYLSLSIGWLVAILLALFTTYAIVVHLAVPSLDWLSPEQQQRIVAIYDSVTPTALPLLILNSWVIWFFSRRRN